MTLSRNKEKLCHEDMITCILILLPETEGSKKFATEDPDQAEGKDKTELRKTLQYITSSRDGTVKIWNAKTMKCDHIIKIGVGDSNGKNKFWINCIQYMTKSKRLVAACADRTLKFYDLGSTNFNTPVSVISEMDGLPLCMDYFLKPKQGVETLVVGDDLGICHMYDFEPSWHSCIWKIGQKDHDCCHKDEIAKNIAEEIGENEEKQKHSK